MSLTKYAKGKFKFNNPQKYNGTRIPTYRSSWELQFMMFLDNNASVTSWSSEAIKIPYINPFKQKKTVYIPDFLIHYNDKDGNQITELIEIKPSKETSVAAAGKSKLAQARAILNHYKWQAAAAWCESQGIKFRILTERELFNK